MSKDISHDFTKNENKKSGRNGFYLAPVRKITDIPPDKYGSFLSTRKRDEKMTKKK